MKRPFYASGRSRALIAIPPEEIPTGTRCVELQIPDSDAAVRQLLGTLNELAFWTNYEREATHAAALWAKAWRAALDANMIPGGCVLPTKLRVDDMCTLSWSYDDWATFDSYDPSACILANIDSVVPGMISDAIAQAIADGLLQQNGGQPSPTGAPEPETCKTVHVVLQANQRWHCPFTVDDGYTIMVTNIKGGWNDGTLAWYCSTGGRYLLGACAEELHSHQTGDPTASGWHMELIGQINSTYFMPGRATYTVPDSTGTSELDFLANDGTLTDNSGQIEFDVTICSPAAAPTWCYTFDFTTSDGGWANYDGNLTTYNPPLGWDATQYFGIFLDIGEGADYQVTDIELTYIVYGPRAFDWYIYEGGVEAWHKAINSGTSYHYDPKPYLHRPAEWRFIVNDNAGDRITSIIIHGTGVCPFGDSNC